MGNMERQRSGYYSMLFRISQQSVPLLNRRAYRRNISYIRFQGQSRRTGFDGRFQRVLRRYILFEYYGEMITYLAMTAPMAVVALVSWLRNPYKGDKSEVEVNSLSVREWCLFSALSVAVTVAFYFILRALDTANLIVSTVSVFSSFAASYLTARRSRFYAVGYAANDVVLIVMWIMQTVSDISYLPMIVCFAAFLVLDVYGFVNWSRMLRRQNDAPQESENAERKENIA